MCLQVRGASSPRDEMAYIMRHSQSCAVILQDSETLDKLLPVLSSTADAASSNGSGQVMPPTAALAWQAPGCKVGATYGMHKRRGSSLAQPAAKGSTLSGSFQIEPLEVIELTMAEGGLTLPEAFWGFGNSKPFC